MQINAAAPRAVVRTSAPVAAPPQPAAPAPVPAPRENGVWRFIKHFLAPSHLWHNPAAKAPANPTSLKIASYNIQLGGQHLDQAMANLKGMNADVICLQETTRESAEAIAKQLGMHMYFASGRMYLDDKAILSKYPITAAEDHAFSDTGWQRFMTYLHGIPKHGVTATEPIGRRSTLHVTLQVGGHTVEVLDPHLSSADKQANTLQLNELADYAKKLGTQGHTVLMAGDFNTDFMQKPDGKPGGATDTKQEWADRYHRAAEPADAANLAAAAKLNGTLQSYWDTAARRVVLSGGKLTSPEAAAASGKTDKRTQRVIDGVSHLGAEQRFDSVFASQDVQMVEAYIDQDHAGSDHQPIMAEVRFLGNS
ncbi:MAG: Endonuclease/Exonuclease/phosphatase family [Cyanobacteria bacterium RYN_339]|nr:Endonuclease/Exonuclease/phosphatase family [Cyanobacteria bacterium RYN_339]